MGESFFSQILNAMDAPLFSLPNLITLFNEFLKNILIILTMNPLDTEEHVLLY